MKEVKVYKTLQLNLGKMKVFIGKGFTTDNKKVQFTSPGGRQTTVLIGGKYQIG